MAIVGEIEPKPLDLPLGEVASLDCQVYDVWSALVGSRFHRDKTFLLDAK